MQWDELFEYWMAFPPEPAPAEKAEQAEPDQASCSDDESAKSEPPVEKQASPHLAFPAGGGVFLLADKHDRLIQLASAADLRRALSIRLLPSFGEGYKSESDEAPQEQMESLPADQVSEEFSNSEATKDAQSGRRHIPSPRERMNLQEIVSRIYWRPSHSVFEITFEYYRLARMIMPEDYLDNVAFGPAWFVHVDPSARLPRFTVNKYLQGHPGTDLGSFASQSAAGRFVQVLEDAFDLCRYIHILEQVPHGQACAYFEMGKCPAPCDGSIPLSTYREMVCNALQFAAGEREAWYAHWENIMKEAAAEQAFEQAAHHKQRLQRAREVEQNAYQLVRPIEQFNYLIVQRGSTRSKVKPFFVIQGTIQPGQELRLKELDQALGDWITRMRDRAAQACETFSRPDDESLDLRYRSEQLWLVSHFLFKKDDPGLYRHVSQLDDPAQLADQIHQRFAPEKSSSRSKDAQANPDAPDADQAAELPPE